jgi:16S rRNA (uracil1498-N3)-methyltransferase
VTPPVFVVPQAELLEASAGSVVVVGGAEGRHAATVRRIGVGEPVTLVDGQGGRATGTVSAVPSKRVIEVRVQTTTVERVPAPRVVVVQALPKGDRGELAVELLTEVGVDVIVPWAAAHCVTQWKGERAERGHRRWVDAAQAAAKQARRARFPEVPGIASTAEVVERLAAAAAALVLHETASTPIGRIVLPAEGDVVVVVGPEGGLSDTELEQFAGAGAALVRLGPTVLRTSSAGIAGVAALLSASDRWSAPKVEG